jgi:hypothetical protein
LDDLEKKGKVRTIRGTRKTELSSQLLLALCVLVGLFFVEYPPLFLLGYWSWGATVHKTITGIFLIVNLILAQYATRRVGSFRASAMGDRKKSRLEAES